MAGLTAATYLVREGVEVLLLEQGSRLGGLVTGFNRQGFYFDAGMRAFENAGILRPMLRELEIDLTMTESKVSMGIGKRRIELEGPQGLDKYLSLLELFFPDEGSTLRKLGETIREVIEHMQVLYGVDNPLFTEHMDLRYLFKTLLPWLIKYQWSMRKIDRLSMDVRDYLQEVTEKEQLMDVLIQHFFKGIPTSFAFSYFYLYQDYRYPEQGTVALIDAMAHRYLQLGGIYRIRSEVVSVDQRTSSVTLSSGEILSYDKLIWAGDLQGMYERLRPDEGINRKLTELRKAEPVESVLTLYLALDLPSEALPMSAHHFLTPSTEGISSIGLYEVSWQAHKKIQWIKDFLRVTTFEMSSPSKREPSLAPIGKSSLIISAIINYDVFKDLRDCGLYDQVKAFIPEVILESIAEAFPGLKDKVIFSEVSTPLTMEAYTLNKKGAISGWASGSDSPALSSFKDMRKAIETGIEHIYQAGQWTFSPAGLPVSILTGKLAAEAVVKSLKKKRA